MREKLYSIFFVIGICCIVFVLAGTAGFFSGRGNLQRSAGLADTDQRIEQSFAELRRELEQERAISAGLRAVSERERQIIDGIAESTRQARADAQAAIAIGGGAAGSLQKILVQMEIYNRYVGDIERRLGGHRDLPGGGEVAGD
jgi:hypothetical protein